jgi:hypothetical protein
MAADEKIHPGSPALDSLGWPVSDLIDEVLFSYDEWRDEATTVEEAYRHWCTAPAAERDRRYGAYLAALDQEETAALMYAINATELRAALQSAG